MLWSLDLTIFTEKTTTDVALHIAIGLIPFVVGIYFIEFIRVVLRCGKLRSNSTATMIFSPYAMKKVLNDLFILFWVIVIAEVIYFRQIPLLAMLMGEEISHFDFGIPGVHGFMFALGTALATLAFAMFQLTDDRSFINYTLIVLAVLILLVTRKVALVIAIQMVIVHVTFKGWKKLGLLFFFVALGVLIFGWIGDIRTGRDAFLGVAGLKVAYPDFLPSGLIWVYVYAITPMANYMSMLDAIVPSFVPVALISWLIPGGVIDFLTGAPEAASHSAFEYSWQVSGAFNVAAGYASIYPTLGGEWGVAIFSLLVGSVVGYYRRKNGFIPLMILTVLYSCSVLMVFNNNFMSLNVIFQVVIFLIAGFVYRRYTKSSVGHQKGNAIGISQSALDCS